VRESNTINTATLKGSPQDEDTPGGENCVGGVAGSSRYLHELEPKRVPSKKPGYYTRGGTRKPTTNHSKKSRSPRKLVVGGENWKAKKATRDSSKTVLQSHKNNLEISENSETDSYVDRSQ